MRKDAPLTLWSALSATLRLRREKNFGDLTDQMAGCSIKPIKSALWNQSKRQATENTYLCAATTCDAVC